LDNIIEYYNDAISIVENKITFEHTTKVKSTMEINIHARELTHKTFNDFLNITSPFLGKEKHILINVQDTSGLICEHLAAFNTVKYIHILPPDCTLNTSEVYACPSLTIIDGKIAWINIRDNKCMLFTGNKYLVALYKFLNTKYYLPALLSLWKVVASDYTLHDLLSGEPVEPVTNQNYTMLHDSAISPFIKRRFFASDHLIYIQYIIHMLKEDCTYPDYSKTVTFEDMIIKECADRLSILQIKYNGKLNIQILEKILYEKL
jgi:hypothetical protein